eukprot:Skav202431  [mRNA]  locus=scaffold5371:64145:65536:- [translate_table: standard]
MQQSVEGKDRKDRWRRQEKEREREGKIWKAAYWLTRQAADGANSRSVDSARSGKQQIARLGKQQTRRPGSSGSIVKHEIVVARRDYDTEKVVIKTSLAFMVMTAHPEKGGDPKTFQRLNKAYSVLSDPKKRQEYDETR